MECCAMAGKSTQIAWWRTVWSCLVKIQLLSSPNWTITEAPLLWKGGKDDAPDALPSQAAGSITMSTCQCAIMQANCINGWFPLSLDLEAKIKSWIVWSCSDQKLTIQLRLSFKDAREPSAEKLCWTLVNTTKRIDHPTHCVWCVDQS